MTSVERQLRQWLDQAYAKAGQSKAPLALHPAPLHPQAFTSLAGLVADALAQFGPLHALHQHHAEGQVQTLSFQALAQDARKLAARLQALGLKPGEPAALLAPFSAEMLVAALAVMLTGANLVLLDATIPSKHALPFLLEAKPKVVLTEGGRYLRLNSVGTLDVEHVVLLPWTPATWPEASNVVPWEEALDLDTPFVPPASSPETLHQPALSVLGLGQWVRLTQAQALETLAQLPELSPRPSLVLPFSPVTATFLSVVLKALLSGRALHLSGSLTPEQVVALIDREALSCLCHEVALESVPAQVAPLAKPQHEIVAAFAQGFASLHASLKPAKAKGGLLVLSKTLEVSAIEALLTQREPAVEVVLESPYTGLPLAKVAQASHGLHLQMLSKAFHLGPQDGAGYGQLWVSEEATALWLKPFVGGGYLLR